MALSGIFSTLNSLSGVGPELFQSLTGKQAAESSSKEAHAGRDNLPELKRQDSYVRNTIENLLTSLGMNLAGNPVLEFKRGTDDHLYATDGKVRVNFNGSEIAFDPEVLLSRIKTLKKIANSGAAPFLVDTGSQVIANRLETVAREEISLEKVKKWEEEIKPLRNYSAKGKKTGFPSPSLMFDYLF